MTHGVAASAQQNPNGSRMKTRRENRRFHQPSVTVRPLSLGILLDAPGLAGAI
jgi:hypothetical protein